MATQPEFLNIPQANLSDLAADVVARALRAGATGAEVMVREGTEFSTSVRFGEVEKLQDSGSRGLGLRVFLGQRTASTYSSDFSREGIDRLVRGALELARITSEDPVAALPDAAELGRLPGDLQLYYEDVNTFPVERRIEYARRAEAAALAADPRIRKSDGGDFSCTTGRAIFANSLGFVEEYRASRCSVAAVPIAQDENGGMQRDGWDSMARTVTRLDSPEAVGQEAARRTLRNLGARKIASTRVPLVFEAESARSVLDMLADAVNGDAIYRQASFLAGKLTQKVAADFVNVVDDGTLPGGFGSSPFDDEGLPTRRTVVIENGVLRSYLLNSYTARKLGLRSTGNASRSLAGNPGISTGNFFLKPGSRSAQQIISDVKQGLFVTGMFGYGVNLVTGDISRGASGIWIENGELTYPVEEITIAGNLADMLLHIGEIGNDLQFRGAVAAPTLLINGMTIAGS